MTDAPSLMRFPRYRWGGASCSRLPILIVTRRTDSLAVRIAMKSLNDAFTLRRILLAFHTLLTLQATHAYIGQPCSLAHTRLDPDTRVLQSDCGPAEYCSDGLTDDDDWHRPAPPATYPSSTSSWHASSYTYHMTSSHTTTPAAQYSQVAQYKRAMAAHAHRRSASTTGRPFPQTVTMLRKVRAVANPEVLDLHRRQTYSPPAQGSTNTTCQPRGCRTDEFPFG